MFSTFVLKYCGVLGVALFVSCGDVDKGGYVPAHALLLNSSGPGTSGGGKGQQPPFADGHGVAVVAPRPPALPLVFSNGNGTTSRWRAFLVFLWAMRKAGHDYLALPRDLLMGLGDLRFVGMRDCGLLGNSPLLQLFEARQVDGGLLPDVLRRITTYIISPYSYYQSESQAGRQVRNIFKKRINEMDGRAPDAGASQDTMRVVVRRVNYSGNLNLCVDVEIRAVRCGGQRERPTMTRRVSVCFGAEGIVLSRSPHLYEGNHDSVLTRRVNNEKFGFHPCAYPFRGVSQSFLHLTYRGADTERDITVLKSGDPISIFSALVGSITCGRLDASMQALVRSIIPNAEDPMLADEEDAAFAQLGRVLELHLLRAYIETLPRAQRADILSREGGWASRFDASWEQILRREREEGKCGICVEDNVVRTPSQAWKATWCRLPSGSEVGGAETDLP